MHRLAHAVILYCSAFTAHRTHRELIRCARERGWLINAVEPPKPGGNWYTGGAPFDGVISHLHGGLTQQISPFIEDHPHITLHAKAAERCKLPSVVLDHQAAGRLVGQHFSEYGFRNVAAMGSGSTFESRFEGLSAFMEESGQPAPLKPELNWHKTDTQAEHVQRIADALKRFELPLAIMASDDKMALLVMQACWQNDISIPGQVAICGFDNDPISCDLAPVPLTSVDTDFEAQAQEAIELMVQFLNNRVPREQSVIIEPTGIVMRRSTGIKATQDSTTAKACAYIHDHAMNAALSVPDIAKAVGVSRAGLFAAFRRELSSTPLSYLTDLRIEKALDLIKTTRLPINEIRPQCGFNSDYQMYQAFRRVKGKSPGRFR